MAEPWIEAQCETVVGPTHHFGGLSFGNQASHANGGLAAFPRKAALQSLAKLARLQAAGVPQILLPPQIRPALQILPQLGLGTGITEDIVTVGKRAPEWLSPLYSSAFMWTANAATMAPGCDTEDGITRFVPANLSATRHRALESLATRDHLRQLFSNQPEIEITDPLPALAGLQDEGAANHNRLCLPDGQGPGLHLFVHGHHPDHAGPKHFPARQTFSASQAVARLLKLPEARVLHFRQNPSAIDAGVFHHDVIGIGHRDTLIIHEQALAGGENDLKSIQRAFRRLFKTSLRLRIVTQRELPLKDAVSSYLFNNNLAIEQITRTSFEGCGFELFVQ